jgi:SulP family sulfate permease
MEPEKRQTFWRGLLTPTVVGTLARGYGRAALRNDFFGGVTAAVVALPLALAFGVASGAGPIAGLYGAIAAGFFAALFGGTPSQITGPTGPMTVVMAAVVAAHANSLTEAFTIVMLGGLLQIVFGLLRVGSYVTYAPASVVSGFMTGVGLIILIIQSLPFLGLPTAPNGVPGTIAVLSDLPLGAVDWPSATLAAGSLLLLVYWPARVARLAPAPLGVLVIATAIAALAFSGVPVIGPIPSALPGFVVPDLSADFLTQTVQPAFILALLGSIDSLLTSLVADTVTKTQHDSDKELVGQGIGNFVAGLVGGLPAAGATMRTVINIRAGGRTAVSGMIHSLVLLALALGLGRVVGLVPTPVLAAILMKVGWDIVDWGYLKRLRRLPREKAIVMLVTCGLTVFVDLITAVAVGIILASFVNSRWLAAEQLKGLRQSADADELEELTVDERAMLRKAGNRVLLTMLRGSFSYASARELARRDRQAMSEHEAVIYDFSHAGYIDPSAALAIDEMIDLSCRHGRHVVLCGIPEQARKALDGMGVLERVPPSRRFGDRAAAIEAAVKQVLDAHGAASSQ